MLEQHTVEQLIREAAQSLRAPIDTSHVDAPFWGKNSDLQSLMLMRILRRVERLLEQRHGVDFEFVISVENGVDMLESVRKLASYVREQLGLKT